MLGLHMERSRSRWIYPASTPLNPPRWPSQAKFTIPMSTKTVAVSAWGEFFWILSHDSLSCHVVIIAIKCLNPAPSTKRRHLAWMRNWFGAQAGLLTLLWSKCLVDQVTAGPNLTLFFKGPDNCHLRAKHELTSKHWRLCFICSTFLNQPNSNFWSFSKTPVEQQLVYEDCPGASRPHSHLP